MTRTQIYLPQKQISQLKKTAFRESVSISALIRSLIDKGLEKGRQKKIAFKTQTVGQWFLSLAKEAERSGWKGPKDLSKNMDKYLYGSQ